VQLRRGCSESDGIAAVNRPTSILQLTDDEQHQLSQVAVARLHALDFPCIIVPPPKRRKSKQLTVAEIYIVFQKGSPALVIVA